MENSEIVEIQDSLDQEIREVIVITNEDGSQISMLKSTWDEQQKAAELGGTL